MDYLLCINELEKHSSLGKIFVSGLEKENKFLISKLGGPIKASKLLGVKYSRLKEWLNGRRPIPLSFLITAARLSDSVTEIEKAMQKENLFFNCRYSPQMIKLPKIMTVKLAYITGVILGDGCL
jgi:DNA-binding transcriptional regulator YdaS (Cro superfamily)